MNFLNPRLLLGATLVLGACSSVPSSNIGGTPDSQIVAMSEQELSAHRAERIARTQRLTQERLDAYKGGDTVTVSGDGLSYSIQWMKLAGMINIRVVAASSEFGVLTQGTITMAADHNGQPILTPDGTPIILTANSASMEANGRFFAGGIMNVLGAASNGSIAAKINAEASCTENCLGDLTQISVNSASTAETETEVSVEGCPSCGILGKE